MLSDGVHLTIYLQWVRAMIWVLNPLLFMLVVCFMYKGPACCPLCSWVVYALLYVKYAVLSLCPQAVHTVLCFWAVHTHTAPHVHKLSMLPFLTCLQAVHTFFLNVCGFSILSFLTCLWAVHAVLSYVCGLCKLSACMFIG